VCESLQVRCGSPSYWITQNVSGSRRDVQPKQEAQATVRTLTPPREFDCVNRLSGTRDRTSRRLRLRPLRTTWISNPPKHKCSLPAMVTKRRPATRLRQTRAARSALGDQACRWLTGSANSYPSTPYGTIRYRKRWPTTARPSRNFRQCQASETQFREFVTHRSVHHLKEADPHLRPYLDVGANFSSISGEAKAQQSRFFSVRSRMAAARRTPPAWASCWLSGAMPPKPDTGSAEPPTPSARRSPCGR
jgi:hypothetical protein